MDDNRVALLVKLPTTMSVRNFKLSLLDTEQRLISESSILGAAYREALTREAMPPQVRPPRRMAA